VQPQHTSASMDMFAQQQPDSRIVTLLFLGVGACLVVWAVILEAWFTGRPVLAYQPRRRVPWRFWDILAVVFFYVGTSILVFSLLEQLFPLQSKPPDAKEPETFAHPIVQLLAVKDWAAIVLCSVIAVVVAPVVEEMFFRVLLQGWLEKVDRTWRRRVPALRSMMPLAAMPILVSSLVFAGQHFRVAEPQVSPTQLVLLFVSNGITGVLSLVFGIAWLRLRAGATAADLGWDPQKIVADVRLGLVAFAAIAAPIYLCMVISSNVIQILVEKHHLLPKQFAADPIPIFFFALALGFLYNRTHRAGPSIALHMALNASSLAMFFLWG
jgi:membrane protease YdiL (CAAX protease family)